MTEFELKVYKYLQTIPKAKVVSYGQLAKGIGCPKASRAVGNALHKNPLPDVYPCYKVVNAQGYLAKNFGLGIEEQKRRLEKDGVEVIGYRVGSSSFWETSVESNILDVKNRIEFRKWLKLHSLSEAECWVELKRGKPKDAKLFYYLDAVEEALCFGWIDSTQKVIDGKRMQRFSPRKKKSPWSELNKERVRRLEKLGLMTDAGRNVLPAMDENSFKLDGDIEAALKAARCWSKFLNFPPLYQRVRAYNVSFYKSRNPEIYNKALEHLIAETQKGKMFGEWNDYGRLLDY